MATTITPATRRLMLDALDATWNGGKLRLYSAPRPAAATDAPTGTLVAENAALPADLYAAAAGTTKALNAPVTVTGAAGAGAGTDAAWFRLESADGTHRVDGDVSHTAGAGDLKLDNVRIAQNQVVTVTALPLS